MPAAAAGLVVAGTAGMAWLSRDFVYGVGHAERPIPLFLILYTVSWSGFALGAWWAVRGRAIPLRLIVAVALGARALMIPANLVQESDCYRYVLDGMALLHGVNPYAHPPAAIGAHAPPAFAVSLATPEAAVVLARVSYPEIPTVYPPLAQAAFAVGAWLTPWDWLGQRLVFLACDVATLAALAWVLRRARQRAAYLLVYAWNPLVIKEIANSAHSDSLAGLCLAVLVGALLAWERQVGWRWCAVAGVALGGAVLARLYPVVLAPVVAVWFLRHPGGLRSAAACLATAGFAVALGYLPFIDIGWDRLTAGLQAYMADWRRNEGLFKLIGLVPQPRAVVHGLTLAAAGIAAWRLWRGAGGAMALAAAVQGTLLAWFLVQPAAFPWYAVPLMAVSVLRPRAWAVVASGVLSLYYLLFLYAYRDFDPMWEFWTELAQHGAIGLALIVPLVGRHMRRGMEEPAEPAR